MIGHKVDGRATQLGGGDKVIKMHNYHEDEFMRSIMEAE